MIRQETPADFDQVSRLIEQAFKRDPDSDHTEQLLVENLRNSPAFIPELSLVAEKEGIIAGHILLSRVWIKSGKQSFESLALAPVSVSPAFQNQGIGGKLILESHERARKLGYSSVVVLGHADYYPRFGYERAAAYKIKLPFDVPEENCMVLALTKGGLDNISGLVEYPPEFYR